MTAYADLDALAAKGDGTLWRYGERWTYEGAIGEIDHGQHFFSQSIPDSRVQDAVANGAYVVFAQGFYTDVVTGDPAQPWAVVAAVIAKPATGTIVVRLPSDLGTPRAVVGALEPVLATTSTAPSGFTYLMDPDGSRLTDADGAYLMEAI